MVRPIDASKFRKSLTKNIDGISVGFNDPKTWISTNNYLLNYILSGSFKRGVPLGKTTLLAGESGSGKSLIAANVMKEAQKQGVFVVGFDTENAHDEKWLHDCGVDTSDDKYLRIQVSMVDDVAKSISQFMADYKAQYKDLSHDERPKILFVVDSLGALLTHTDVDQFNKGDLKGDMGRKPKALNALIKNCVVQFSEWEVGLLATNHTYESQDMFNPDQKISGGCLVAGTKVQMADGSLKEIETIVVGDLVKTMYEDCVVSNTWHYVKPTYTLELEDGQKIECSPEHKFLVSNEDGQHWIKASQIEIGQDLISK